ncbi:Hvp 101 VSH-1 tail protein [Brachyspira suanatina]|uniref:Hvp 101 VSH-1 tail protein n=1 Tax=Brachyspira suanatina TaxID=381802 RepID=A0A0G4KAR6_9SPIR|nr:phage tail protein [Brachyspira suanatina]CRF35502.1 Hvp 101 VSH-1 tail protein [Brachyspira suanatina]
MSIILNENNIQAPFQYKISENSFELLKRNGKLELNTNNVQVKVFSGQRLFCADIGYAVDGPLENMEFLIDDIKVYPILLEELKDLQTVDVKDNEIYLVNNDINFKSIIFFPPSDLNKNFKFNITTYSSTFSAFMFDEIAKKLNSLDTNYPIKNYYENTDYKVNDIIKNNGYLYRVFKEFTSDSTDYYLKSNCSLITPFKKLELDTDYKANELIEYENNFFIVQQDFSYNQSSGPLTNLNGLLKPLQDIVVWFDGIAKIYKNQIIIKDNFSYIVLEDIENPVWDNIQSKLDYFNKAENTFYDDTNSGFGNNTNTVQKAIEKLKSGKQDSLRAGNNIDLNGNTISVIGGTNKEYVTGNNYYIDDLIIYDSKLYKVNENFTATDWSTDRAKLTLISSGGGGGSTEAIDVSYDNSKTNLEYITGYDFPKFKTPIPDTINLILTDVNKTTEYPATITKQADGSYILNASLSNVESLYGDKAILFVIKSIENETNNLLLMNILNIFWKYVGTDDWIANNGDIQIEGITDPIQFEFSGSLAGVSLGISKTDLSNFEKKTYNITLTIKNRQYHSIDTYFLGVDDNVSFLSIYLAYLNLQNNNGFVKLVGSINNTSIGTSATFSFLNTLSNYFNLVSAENYINTTQITSSTGKAVKYYFMQNASYKNAVDLVIAYQDGSIISTDDVFTFNLTPDKNYTVDPSYAEVSNVQELGEVLARRYMIPCYYEQLPDDNGNFLEEEEPANWYLALYDVVTTWELVHNTKAIVYRTEGTKASVSRVNGLQPYGIKPLTGNVTGGYSDGGPTGIFCRASGVFTVGGTDYNISLVDSMKDRKSWTLIDFNSNNQIKSYSDDLVMDNYLVRKWKLKSINGILVKDLLGK